MNGKKKTAAKPKTGLFLTTLGNAGYCATGYCAIGLQALKKEHRSCVSIADTRRLTGSANLDDAFKSAEPGSERWDYGLGYVAAGARNESAVWIEVHPAQTSEVGLFLAKLEWLKAKIARVPALAAMTAEEERVRGTPYYWVATDAGVHISPRMPQAKRLSAAGIRMPTRVVELL